VIHTAGIRKMPALSILAEHYDELGKKLSVAGWLLYSYILASYVYWGVVVASTPTPHFGIGPLVFAWLLAPIVNFQVLTHPFSLASLKMLFWLLVSFAGSLVLLYCLRGVDKKISFLPKKRLPD
jgi:hypothetical protein